jgi:hypothetical protein
MTTGFDALDAQFDIEPGEAPKRDPQQRRQSSLPEV